MIKIGEQEIEGIEVIDETGIVYSRSNINFSSKISKDMKRVKIFITKK